MYSSKVRPGNKLLPKTGERLNLGNQDGSIFFSKDKENLMNKFFRIIRKLFYNNKLPEILSDRDFKKLVNDFLFSYRLLLNAYMHKDIDSAIYNKNRPTWDTIILNLEFGVIIGLYKILERRKDLGQEFADNRLNIISKKIRKLRNRVVAHFDPNALVGSFFQAHQNTGSDLIDLFEAIKKRLIDYQKIHNLTTDVDNSFRFVTTDAVNNFKSWTDYFKK